MTFNCFAAEKANVTLFYFQINDTFINGYYENEDLRELAKPWNNTKVEGRNVHMYNLKPSHTAVYKCIIQHKNGTLHHEFHRLSVTGMS